MPNRCGFVVKNSADKPILGETLRSAVAGKYSFQPGDGSFIMEGGRNIFDAMYGDYSVFIIVEEEMSGELGDWELDESSRADMSNLISLAIRPIESRKASFSFFAFSEDWPAGVPAKYRNGGSDQFLAEMDNIYPWSDCLLTLDRAKFSFARVDTHPYLYEFTKRSE